MIADHLREVAHPALEVRDRGDMRSDVAGLDVPERTVRRQGLGLEYVEAGGGKGTIAKCPDNIRLALMATASRVDDHRSTCKAITPQPAEGVVVEDAGRFRGQGQEVDQDIRAGEEGVELVLTGEHFDAVQFLGGAAPAPKREPERSQALQGILPQDTEAHDADGALAGRGRVELAPAPCALIGLEATEQAVMHGDLRHHIVTHPLRQVRIDETNDRHVRQRRVLEQRIDARTKRQDRLEAGEALEGVRLRLPDIDVAHVSRVEAVAPADHRIGGKRFGEGSGPRSLINIGKVQQQHRAPRMKEMGPHPSKDAAPKN